MFDANILYYLFLILYWNLNGICFTIRKNNNELELQN